MHSPAYGGTWTVVYLVTHRQSCTLRCTVAAHLCVLYCAAIHAVLPSDGEAASCPPQEQERGSG